MTAPLRVVEVDGSSAAVSDVAGLFDLYRQHYGERSQAAACADWLTEHLSQGRLRVYLAHDGDRPVGICLVAPMPASLRLASFWQVRDLYAAPTHRRRGVATALLTRVRDEAAAAGAIRVSLSTEAGNAAALAVYEGLGFTAVEGYRTLAVDVD